MCISYGLELFSASLKLDFWSFCGGSPLEIEREGEL